LFSCDPKQEGKRGALGFGKRFHTVLLAGEIDAGPAMLIESCSLARGKKTQLLKRRPILIGTDLVE
jgi:hypothetical protein